MQRKFLSEIAHTSQRHKNLINRAVLASVTAKIKIGNPRCSTHLIAIQHTRVLFCECGIMHKGKNTCFTIQIKEIQVAFHLQCYQSRETGRIRYLVELTVLHHWQR